MDYIALFKNENGAFDYTLKDVKDYQEATVRAKQLAKSFGWEFKCVL